MTAYLDWNATSPPHPSVLARMAEAQRLGWANPASVHGPGRRAREFVETTRERLAQELGVHPRDVVFTSGGTEANHLALSGASGIVTSALEHPSLVKEAERLARLGTPVAWVRGRPEGAWTPEDLEEALTSLGIREGVVVATGAANHETGIAQPLEALHEVVRRHGARLHLDVVQLVGRAPARAFDVADSLAVCAHKHRGPKGIGALAFRPGFRPLPRGGGGSQERGLRPGTVDAVACAGWGAALERLGESRAGYEKARSLRDRFEAALETGVFGPARVHGRREPGRTESRLGHVSNFALLGRRGDELVAALDLLGVAVSSGSACAAGTAEPSPVITAMLGRDAAQEAVRVSFGEESSESDLEALLSALKSVTQRPSFEQR